MTGQDTNFIELSREMLARSVPVRFRVTGWSMYPIIKEGDVVRIEPAVGRIRYADIVFFQNTSGRAIVHRVVKRTSVGGRASLMTRGDSARQADDYLDERDLIGRVMAIERSGRALSIGKGAWRHLNVLYAALLPVSKWAYILISTAFRKPQHDVAAGRTGISEIPGQNNDEYYKNGARNAIIYEEAKKIIRSFSERGIKTAVLKGIFLAQNIYGNIALRPMTDIDILIKREDLSRTNEALGLLGYSVPAHYESFLENSRVSSINSLMYSDRERLKPSVHIHWHIINSTWPLERIVAGIDMERIWARAVPVSLDGVGTMSLSPEDLIIYLAHHALHHSFDKPTMVTDIVQTLRCYAKEIDWEAVCREADRIGLRFIVYVSLRYVSKVSGVDIRGTEVLKPRKTGIVENAVLRRLEQGPCSYGVSYCAYLATRKRPLDRAGFIVRTLFPSRLVRMLRHGRS